MPELEEKAVSYSTTDVVLVTTDETVVISSGPVKVPRQTCRVLVKAWCILALGAGCNALIQRIRRGTGLTGTLVSEENAETPKVTVGGIEAYNILISEERAGVESVEYTLTLQQAAATANGLVTVAIMEVEILGG